MKGLGLVLWSGACGSSPTPVVNPTEVTAPLDTGDRSIPSTTPPLDTGTGATGWKPTVYRVNSSAFGIRGGQVVPLNDEDYFGTPVMQQIEMRIRLGDDTIVSGPTPNNHCDVVLTWVEEAIAPIASSTGAYLSFEMPPGALSSAAQCDLLHPAPPFDDLNGLIAGYTWGFSVRALSPLDTAAVYGTPEDNALGGSWFMDGGPEASPGLTLAYQVTAEGTVVRDANWDRVPMSATSAWSGTAIQDGLFLGVTLSEWSPLADLLGPVPPGQGR